MVLRKTLFIIIKKDTLYTRQIQYKVQDKINVSARWLKTTIMPHQQTEFHVFSRWTYFNCFLCSQQRENRIYIELTYERALLVIQSKLLP